MTQKCAYSTFSKKLVFIAFFCFGLSHVLHAQDRVSISNWRTSPHILTQTFDQNDGLPVVSLSDIEMGYDGYLYVASYSGLSRFDGTDFQQISSEQFPQLTSNRILRIITTPDSAVWIFDDQYKISRWKAGSVSNYDTLNALGLTVLKGL